MSEELLSAQSGFDGDSWSQAQSAETGLYYRQRHASPYWDKLVDMIFQMHRAVGPARGFRVYIDSTDTALQFSCSAGAVPFAGSIHTYAGAVNLTLTASQTNSIYFDLTDDTLSVSTSGFPDPLDTPHVRIATVAAGASSWAIDTNLTDLRYQQALQPDMAGRTYTRRFQVVYGDLSVADTTKTFALYTLPNRHAVIDAYVEVVTGFTGGSVSAILFDVGVAADPDQYIDGISAFAAGDHLTATAKGARFTSPGNTGIESLTANTVISLVALATGDNLDQLSAGSAYVYLTIRADESA